MAEVNVEAAPSRSLSPLPSARSWSPAPSLSTECLKERDNDDDFSGTDHQIPPPPIQQRDTLVAPEAPEPHLPCEFWLDCDIVDFQTVVPGDCENPQQLRKITLALQPNAASRIVKEGTPLMVAIVLLSLVSFGFVAFYFSFVLRVPSAAKDLPVGFDSWTSCPVNSTRPSTTALGRELPLSRARTFVSVPKLFAGAMAISIVGCLTAGWRSRAACMHAAIVCVIALAAMPVYIIADVRGAILPAIVDPVIGQGMLLSFLLTQTLVVGSRTGSSRMLAKFPKTAFFLVVLFMFFLSAVLVNVNMQGVVAKYNINPGLAVGISALVVRASGFAGRIVFRNLKLPGKACFAITFSYEMLMVITLRRYWLALPNLGDVVVAAICSAVVEVACNAFSILFAIHRYNDSLKNGHIEMAQVHCCVFFTSIICETLVEHMALHGYLGFSLYLDPRILTMSVQFDTAQAVAAWGVSLGVELVVDVLSLIPAILFVPVSMNKLLCKWLRSALLVGFLVTICLYAQLGPLHNFLDRDSYLCH